MLTAAVAVMGLGTVGTFAAVGMEIWLREPIYLVVMKVTVVAWGIGATLFAWALRSRGG